MDSWTDEDQSIINFITDTVSVWMTKQAQECFQSFDIDENGFISKIEFVKGASSLVYWKIISGDEAVEPFEIGRYGAKCPKWGLIKKGAKPTEEKLEDYMKQLSAEDKERANKLLGGMFDEIDTNKDGKLSFKEFEGKLPVLGAKGLLTNHDLFLNYFKNMNRTVTKEMMIATIEKYIKAIEDFYQKYSADQIVALFDKLCPGTDKKKRNEIYYELPESPEQKILQFYVDLTYCRLEAINALGTNNYYEKETYEKAKSVIDVMKKCIECFKQI